MAESTIITGQFVRISQTPASIGERLIALAIDYILLGFYVFSTLALFSRIHLPSDFTMLFFFTIVYLPVLLYAFLCEMFNQGQSFGKRLMNIRVVKADGSTPGIGSYLLRWLLFPIDGPVTGGLGLLVVLLTKNSQRMGDLAAGTMVIKEKNYRKIHVSLDEFDYLRKNAFQLNNFPSLFFGICRTTDLPIHKLPTCHWSKSTSLPGPCNRVKKTVHAALPPLRKKCRNFSPSLLMTVTRKTFFRPFSGITSIMPWKKFNTNFQQNQRSVKSYAYLRFKLHLFGFSFVNQPEGLN